MSGLSASMWTSVSGLLSHSKKMQVVGNNIANVSTIGFKGQRMDFNDYLYTSGSSASGSVQMGAGANVYALLGDFSQGSFESTNSFSDLAIDGKGFFGVRDPNSRTINYSRAGDFYFNEKGQFVNPQGYVVQGRPVDNSVRLTFNNGVTDLGTTADIESAYVGGGSPQDVLFESWNINAQRTTSVSTAGTGLLNNISDQDKSTSITSPLTALFDSWNANAEPPLARSAYAQSSTMSVYDEGGSTHDLTIYYDAVSLERTNSDGSVGYALEGLPAGCKVYEYLVTIPPEEDMRSYGGEGYDVNSESWAKEPTRFYKDPVTGETCKNAGVLASGILIFDSSGNLIDQTAYSFGATETPDPNNQVSLNPDLKTAWQPTKISNNGFPTFTANFTGQPLANSVSETMTSAAGVTPYSQAEEYIIELNMGLKQVAQPAWENTEANSVLLDANGKPYFTSANNNVNSNLAMSDGSTVNGVELGTDSPLGYYYVSTDGAWAGQKVFGDAANPANCVYGDEYGYYTSATGAGDRIYGQINVGGNKTIGVNANGKFFVAGDPNNTQYEYTDGTLLLNKDGNGYYTLAATATGGANQGDAIYGMYSDPAGGANQNRAVMHDAQGYYYINDAGQRTELANGLNTSGVKSYSSGNVKGVYEYAAATNDANNYIVKPKTFIEPVTGNAGNSLASLMTQLEQKADGSWQATVNLNTNAATMTAGEKQDNAIVANKDTYVNQTEQNGYGSGRMTNMEFDTNGVLYVTYNNGVTLPMWQLCIYDFENYQGLYREGGNLYSATMESGNPMLGVAGDNGFGNVLGYNIEQSNVDMTTEFVQMIATQRGFQANSKGVTTTDTMLETVINMKR